jgi:hypothetical protein
MFRHSIKYSRTSNLLGSWMLGRSSGRALEDTNRVASLATVVDRNQDGSHQFSIQPSLIHGNDSHMSLLMLMNLLLQY